MKTLRPFGIALAALTICVQHLFSQVPRGEETPELSSISGETEPLLNLPPSAVSVSSGNQLLDSLLVKEMTRIRLPGLAVCAFTRSGILWKACYGYANVTDKTPVTDSTVFCVASISKTITAAAIFRLYQGGRLGLDDDVNLHLPFSVRNPNYPSTPITVRMLLTHTSSIDDYWTYIPRFQGDPTIPLSTYLESYFVPGGSRYSATRNFLSISPGTGWHYTNMGIALCGAIVEQEAGIPFDHYCRDSIFLPLRMTHTSWRFGDLDTNLVARSYYNGAEMGLLSHHMYPAGELKTTLHALARFFRAHMRYGELDGIRILDSTTVRSALTAQFPRDFSYAGAQGSVYKNYFYYLKHRQGICWYMGEADGVEIWAHEGWWPGWSSGGYFNDSADVGVLFLTNGSVPEPPDGDPRRGFSYGVLMGILLNAAGYSFPGETISPVLENKIYAVSADSLFSLAPSTFERTAHGALNVGPFSGLSVHPGTNEMYTIRPVEYGTEIRRLSASNGYSRHVTNTLAEGLKGSAIDASGVLYAVAPLAAAGGQLYSIDLSTGSATLIKTYSSARFHGLAMDPSGSFLWASGRTLRGYDCIYTIDPATGDTTFVGKTGDGRITNSLTFSNGGLLGTQAIGTSTGIISIDTSTGQGALVGSLANLGITAIAASPTVTGVGASPTVPLCSFLSQNYPNPFNPSTTVRFEIPERSHVRLAVYNMLGQLVSTVFEGVKDAGYHQLTFNDSRLSSGMYFYRIEAISEQHPSEVFTATKKMLIVK